MGDPSRATIPPGAAAGYKAAMTRRNTIKAPVSITGTALHSGVAVAMTLSPAAGTGIVFRRTDLVGLKADIPARYDLVAKPG